MIEDVERCYRIVCSRDPRYDGWFVTGVTTTGIYCRPSCPARTPQRRNVTFHPSAAAAVAAGFRACRRCRPDATPGSPGWHDRSDLAGRALRLLADGVVDRDGVAGLALRLGCSERQLHRVLVAEVGAGALALARVQRAHTARVMLESTALPVTHVAFAAGFSSIRQCNETVQAVYGTTPTGLRGRRGTTGAVTGAETGAGTLSLRLAARAPLDAAATLSFLGARAVPGVEERVAGTYRRVLSLPHGTAVVTLADGGDHVAASLRLAHLADLGAAVARCRRLLDLDADPVAVDGLLGADPLLGPLVRSAPGTRVPGHVDGAELALRAILGQQVSVAGARTLAGRLVTSLGEPLAEADGGLTHRFPTPDAVAASDPSALAMPRSRARAVVAVAAALADGRLVLDAGADREEAEARLLALPGIGPWTASYVAMRALGDPDAFLAGDLGVRRALERLGHPGDERAVAASAEAWRPWRAYATIHLWRSLDPTARTTTARPDEPGARPPCSCARSTPRPGPSPS